MKSAVQMLLLGLVAIGGLLSPACQRRESDHGYRVDESAMSEFRAKLESGDTLPREKPFVSRSFEPFPGERWVGDGVAYGCYRRGQAPGQNGPSEAQVLEDLRLIAAHWKLIRVYGADDDTRRILEVIERHGLPIRVMLGIWLEAEGDSPERRKANIDQALKGIELANRYPKQVVAVSVGNETQVYWSAHRMDPQHLIRYLRLIRAGVTVPVTTADDFNFWNKPESRPVAEEIDFIVTHIHPLWNGKSLEDAIDWLDGIWHEMQERHPDRLIVLGETGWATAYDPGRTGPGEQGTLVKGEVGLVGQASFLSQLHQWVEANQVTTFLFEAFDEPWKGGGESSSADHIEKHWGVFNEDRSPKESFLQYLAERRQTVD